MYFDQNAKQHNELSQLWIEMFSVDAPTSRKSIKISVKQEVTISYNVLARNGKHLNFKYVIFTLCFLLFSRILLARRGQCHFLLPGLADAFEMLP